MRMAVAVTGNGHAELLQRVHRSESGEPAPDGLRWCRSAPDGRIIRGFPAAANDPLHPNQHVLAPPEFKRDCATAPRIHYRVGQDVVEIDCDPERLAASDGERPALNAQALLHFVWRGRAPSGQTLYRDVRALAMGEALVFSHGHRPLVRRVDWPLAADTVAADAQALVEELPRRIDDALGLILSGDGDPASERIGLFLSGGVDSGLLAALAARRKRAVTGYTIAFDDAYGLNEAEYARRVARKLKIRHRVVRVGIDDALRLLDAVLDNPHPCAAIATMTHAALREAAVADGQQLVLSGLGADECLGGYHKPLACLAAQIRQLRVRGLTLQELYAMPSRDLSRRADVLFFGIAEFFTLAEMRQQTVGPGRIDDFVHADVEFYRQALAIKPGALPTELMAAHEYAFRVSDLLLPAFHLTREDSSCDVAFPFLEPGLYRWASSIEPGMHYWYDKDAWWAKHLLRTVAGRFLPQSIVMRKRQVLLAPFAHWLLDRRFRDRVIEEIGDSPFWRLAVLKPATRERFLQQLRRYRRPVTDERWPEQLWVLLAACAWVNRRAI
ncbi:MAG: hypothetical protein E6Q88_11520 [Lysobacteraceae bacterium]|nr:MAG: hypothetical protein E6Q88_11520 [Xanthomonadaceae bacterium]